MEIHINSEAELDKAAREFLKAIGDNRHIALLGEMGAGKTTFTSALCRLLGVEDDVTSPTFSIINEYCVESRESRVKGQESGESRESRVKGQESGESGKGRVKRVFHFDFYRIEEPEQAMDLGLDEYFDSDALCLMEWPDNVEGFLPDDTLRVEIRVNPDNSRTILIP